VILAKHFGGPNSAKLVNGILGSIYDEIKVKK
jgi:transcription termination factor NusB